MDRQQRAANVVDTSHGMAGGKAATRHLKGLIDE
jgi:hypothetical protein